MFTVFRAHAASGAALMFTSGPDGGVAVGTFEGEPLYHASLDATEYRALLAHSGMALRPSQIRATSEDGALMISGALGLRGRYKDLKLPVTIVGGKEDRVIFKKRSEQLAANIPGSTLRVVPGAGHMVHYAAPGLVVEAVEAIGRGSKESVRSHDAPQPGLRHALAAE